MRKEGERLLRQRYGTDFRHCCGADLRPEGLDVILDGLLEILAKVTATERAWAS